MSKMVGWDNRDGLFYDKVITFIGGEGPTGRYFLAIPIKEEQWKMFSRGTVIVGISKPAVTVIAGPYVDEAEARASLLAMHRLSGGE